jgi:Holliday junction resolvase RusA-like endonuclease
MSQTFTILSQVSPKKNSKQIIINPRTRRPMIISSKGYNQWHTDALWQLKSVKEITEYPATISIVFYVKDNRRRDNSNMLQSIEDTLVDAGILKDDSWQCLNIGSVRSEIDAKNPRAEVVLS